MKRFFKENWILIISLLYILSPFDFIPEMFLGPIGIIDDSAIVIFLLIQAVLKHFRKGKSSDIIEGEEIK